MRPWDVIIIGAGPAGSAAAISCAQAGLRILVLERSHFPRHKVCGDCLNPQCEPLLSKLGITLPDAALPALRIRRVELINLSGTQAGAEFPDHAREWVSRREDLDARLASAASTAGAEIRFGEPVLRIRTDNHNHTVETAGGSESAPWLIAADGRNSTTARLLGLSTTGTTERVGLQTHAKTETLAGDRVVLRLLPFGYGGFAPLPDNHFNLCLVTSPHRVAEAKAWARDEFSLTESQPWHTISPLDRSALPPAPLPGVVLAGDTARVVEPFTGEGIRYALATGILAADSVISSCQGGITPDQASKNYASAHRRLYQGRLWLNRLTRHMVRHPRTGDLLIAAAARAPFLLKFLTAKVSE